MGALQPWHLIVILVIVLVIFGPGKLPELGKALGEGMRELKRATKDDTEPAATTAPAAVAPAVAPAPAATTTVAAPVQAATVSAPVANGAVAAPVATAPAPAAVDTKCPRCQATVTAGTRFCGSCGAPVTA